MTIHATEHLPLLSRTPEAQPQTAEELDFSVISLLAELDNPSSRLHARYYGEGQIQSLPITEVNRPFSGHIMLALNETEHPISANGRSYNAGTFKQRGSLLAALLAPSDVDTFVTFSAGNHGLGVANAARLLGKRAHIYCRSDISSAKEAKLLELGATLFKNDLDDPSNDTLEFARTRAEAAAQEQDHSYLIHPFDQVEVIAGQAGIGQKFLAELFERAANGELDPYKTPVDITVPVGGGGLITGIAIVIKQARDEGLVGSNVRVIGAQLEGCDAAIRTVERIKKGQDTEDLFPGEQPNTLSDGTAVVEVGKLAKLILADERYVQGFVHVSELDLARAVHETTGIYHKATEGAANLGYAAAKKCAEQQPTRDGHAQVTYMTPITGANIAKATYQYLESLRTVAYRKNLASLGERRVGRSSDSGLSQPLLARQIGCRVAAGAVIA